MAQASAVPTTIPIISVRPENPAAQIHSSIANAVCGLQDIAVAARLLTRDLKTEYPHGRAARAEVANLYAALITELGRVAGDMIGGVARLGDDVLGVMSDRERKNSHNAVREYIHDDWAALFSGFADQECEDEITGPEQWARYIVDTLRAVQARRVAVAA